MRHLIALLAALCLTAPPADAQDDHWPDNAYGAALQQAMTPDPRKIDFAALRKVYAASDHYTGRSALDEHALNAFAAEQLGKTAVDWTEAEVNRAFLADFPLAETQYAAFLHVKDTSPADENRLAMHAIWYRGIVAAILATHRTDAEGSPVYTVLSVAEQHHVLSELGRKRAGRQSLLDIDGVPHDRIETDKGPVLFDISAFFGRQTGDGKAKAGIGTF